MKRCAMIGRSGIVPLVIVMLASALATGAAVYAAETAVPSSAISVKVPETAEEHLAMAQNYRQKVKMYLSEVETHQQMLEAYKNHVPSNPKVSMENPWLTKMRKHCEGYITEARSLAAEAQAFADYHELRGKELQGQ